MLFDTGTPDTYIIPAIIFIVLSYNQCANWANYSQNIEVKINPIVPLAGRFSCEREIAGFISCVLCPLLSKIVQSLYNFFSKYFYKFEIC